MQNTEMPESNHPPDDDVQPQFIPTRLEQAYAAMAADHASESEALEWAEALLSDAGE